MQKKILVAVDGSPSSRQAVDYAGRQIETRTDATLSLGYSFVKKAIRPYETPKQAQG